jgi:diguanylate cyclase (GGDEF)-like protein/PAS domain S-box-containing protein
MVLKGKHNSADGDLPLAGESTAGGLTSALAVQLLHTADGCVFALDGHWRFIYANPAAVEQIASGKCLIGKSLWSEFPQAKGTEFEIAYRRAMELRETVRFEAYFNPLSSWFEVCAAPLASGGLSVWFRNINVRKDEEQVLRLAEERFRLAASAAADLITEWDLATGKVTCSKVVSPRLGFSEEFEVDAQWCADRVHPDDRERVSEAVMACLEGADSLVCETRFLKPDGEYAHVEQRSVVHRDSAGSPVRLISALRDLTGERKASAELQRRESKLTSILGQALVGIMEAEPDGRPRMTNQRFCEILGRTEGELQDCLISELTHPDDLSISRKLLNESLVSGEPYELEKRYVRPDGSVVWCKVNVSFVLSPDATIDSCIIVAEDISERRANEVAQQEAARQLRWTSEHDSLTKLANRRAFESHLHATIIRAMHGGSTVGVLLLDLDHFKHVNDTLGHAAGDHLLGVFSRRLKRSVRAGDFVARLGGDEFAVIFESSQGDVDLPNAGASILQRLQKPIRYGSRLMSAGASIGGAIFPRDAQTANELINNADTALYAMKQSGRGGTRMFDPHMRQESQIASSQLSLARSAITPQSVEPHYQQKVDLISGRIVGFEALLRWRHATQGIQHPQTVAEAFKDYELASKIGDYMQRRVFRDMRDWLKRGLPVGFVAINAAPVEFLRDDFAERLMARMAEYQIPANIVGVEVTEHVFLDRGFDFVGRALEVLSRAGIKIALDDFGTGYSSLSHLRDYPVDMVKIDRSFVGKVTYDSEVRAIVCAVLELAKSLKLDVVAEGVETEEQRRLLIEQGCRLGQGYLFGQAVEADEVPHLLGQPRHALAFEARA